MANSVFKEEETAVSKINFGVWGKTFKYIFKKRPLIILIFASMTITSFYDSSFIPSMNAALIDCSREYLNVFNNILNVTLTIEILGISFSLSFLGYIILYVVMIIIRSVAIFITFYTMNYFEMVIMTGLRRDAFRRVQELSYSYYDRTPSGWIISRLQNDASSIGDVLSHSVLRIFWILMNLIFTLVTMFSRNWLLSLIILATTPLLLVIVIFFRKLMLKRGRVARNAYSDFVRWLAECINGTKTVKTLAVEETIYQESIDITEDVQRKREKSLKVGASFQPLISMLSAITNAIIIGVFPILGIDNEVIFTTATLVLFIGFVGQVYNPIQQFTEIFSEIIQTQANVEKLFSLIDTKPELVDSPEVIAKYGDLFNNKKENFEKLEGDIRFEHVSFSYIPGTEVIHDMNLHIEKGTSVAIVGETGSGKSTTVNLLCRFYEPTRGHIYIDGVDYKDRSVGWIRSNIGYVQQTPFIFKGTIYDNIRYGKNDATDEEIRNICKLIDIDDFIVKLRNGYDTFLEDGGNELSLGQKQLISFARAVIRDPAILILDEATSSIDTETEADIQRALNKILKGRTSILIAHRLSTIVNCDRIVVVKDGLIIEDGNHVSLMNQKGYYYELYMNQFKEMSIETQIDLYETQVENKGIKL